MSGKFVIPYTNIGGGFGIAGSCGTSTEVGSLVLSSRALHLLCRDIISGRTCNEVTFLRFVVLTSCQLFQLTRFLCHLHSGMRLCIRAE